MAIEVIVAHPHGFCGDKNYGVMGAINLALKTKKENPKTYILGKIVHNDWVVKALAAKDIPTVQRLTEVPQGATVVIRAHGEPPETYQKLKERGLNYKDGTCPMVKAAQRVVRELTKKGKTVVYVASKKDHEEAIGVVGQAASPKLVILTTLKELENLKITDPQNTTVVTQTTLSIFETAEKLERLKKRYPGLRLAPHVCRATTERQAAVAELAKRVEVMVVVGSPESSNSQRLGEVAKRSSAGKIKVIMVDTASELKPEDFKGVKKVGVTAGASTPEELLKEVIEKIKTFKTEAES